MTRTAMHFCFIVEDEYRRSRLPMTVVQTLAGWGHTTSVLEPRTAVVHLEELVCARELDAAVLRTASGGPGLSLLQAMDAAGVVTINNARAVSRVRDKVVMAALARAHGLPVPDTYFVADLGVLEQLPVQRYPVVVKPSEGGFGRDVRVLRSRDELRVLVEGGAAGRHLVVQPLVPNSGDDVKLYNTGHGIHAVRRRSSLMGGADGERERMPLSDGLRELALRIGRAFELDIYGADVVDGPDGPVIVDVNDFPSFGRIDSAPEEIARTIVDIAQRPRGHRTL